LLHWPRQGITPHYPTFWVNRMNAPVEELGATPDGIGSGMADLVKFVLG
jgi:2-haloacid dehalogenase